MPLNHINDISTIYLNGEIDMDKTEEVKEVKEPVSAPTRKRYEELFNAPLMNFP